MRYTLATVHAYYRYYRHGHGYPNPRLWAVGQAIRELPNAWRVAMYKRRHG